MNYDNIFVLSPGGSGSMYLWDLIEGYFDEYHNDYPGECFKQRPHKVLTDFSQKNTIYHVSFPTSHPGKWLSFDMLPKTRNRFVFITRTSLYSIYSNYRRFFTKDKKAGRKAVVAAIQSYKKGVEYTKAFTSRIPKKDRVSVTYESLMQYPEETLESVSECLDLKGSWTSVLKKNPPKDRNDFRFLKDETFINGLKKSI